MASSKFIERSEPSPGVVLLRLNRKPVNAFNEPYWRELQATFDALSKEPAARVIVLSSAIDKTFSAGLDLMDAKQSLGDAGGDLDTGRKAYLRYQHVKDFQGAISSIAACHKPVIAAINGLCLGLGVDITSACDVRLASSSAKFGILEVNVGLAADIGSLQRFPKITGNDSLARELALTGRIFSADEACAAGFVSRVIHGGRDEVEREALDVARTIAGKSPVAVLGTKVLMNHSRDHSIEDGLEYTAAWNMAMLQAEDTTMAVNAFSSKRPVTFRDMPIAHARL